MMKRIRQWVLVATLISGMNVQAQDHPGMDYP